MPDMGSSCWICLEDGPDEAGKPLVRDCSCRGSAGFTHLSCIVKYAEQKTKQLASGGNIKYEEYEDPWQYCPNCHQQYQNHLAIDMATEHISWLEENFPNDDLPHVQALFTKLTKYAAMAHVILPQELRGECKQVANKILSLIGKMRSNQNNFPMLLAFEQTSYAMLGKVCLMDYSKEGARLSMAYLEKYRDCCKVTGSISSLTDAETMLARAKSVYEGGNGVSAKKTIEKKLDIEKLRESYFATKAIGKDTPQAIKSGLIFSERLKTVHHGIEAERLLEELAEISRQVHGPEHNVTKNVELALKDCKMRVTWVMDPIVSAKGCDPRYHFVALRYKGRKCVVQQGKSTFCVDQKDLALNLGTPVACHGLKKALHLNGKIGDVRYFNSEAHRYEVHFEDASLKPVSVKPDYVRILFELPEK